MSYSVFLPLDPFSKSSPLVWLQVVRMIIMLALAQRFHASGLDSARVYPDGCYYKFHGTQQDIIPGQEALRSPVEQVNCENMK